jgi:hypothetical protein
MIVDIRIRDDNGQFTNASAHAFAQAALKQIGNHGWVWMRTQIAKYCIQKAEEYAENPEVADRWYRRYQSIRGIE